MTLDKKHSYHAGLLKKPYNTKHLLFSGQQRKKELIRKIGQKKEQLETISRSQNVAEYHKVLVQLVELKVKFLEILQTELSELDSACNELLQ